MIKLLKLQGNDYQLAWGSAFKDLCDDAELKKLVGQLHRVVGSRATWTLRDALPFWQAMDGIAKWLRSREKARTLNKHASVVLTACEHPIIRQQVTVMALVNDALTMPLFMTTKCGSHKDKSSAEMGPLARDVTRVLKVRTHSERVRKVSEYTG